VKLRRILIGAVVLAGLGLIFQMSKFFMVVSQAQHPLGPDQRFAVSPAAPTKEEMLRAEKELVKKSVLAKQKQSKPGKSEK
jgi:hypothetical protein